MNGRRAKAIRKMIQHLEDLKIANKHKFNAHVAETNRFIRREVNEDGTFAKSPGPFKKFRTQVKVLWFRIRAGLRIEAGADFVPQFDKDGKCTNGFRQYSNETMRFKRALYAAWTTLTRTEKSLTQGNQIA